MNTPLFATPQSRNVELVQKSLALTHVALHGAGELTRLVAETHATILAAPLPWRRNATQPAHQAPFPYRLIAHGFLYLAHMTRNLLRQTSIPASEPGRLIYSALNGVCGDKLEAWSSPLAQCMMLCNEDGERLPDDWSANHRKIIIFIHGLCLSEREWQTSEHQSFTAARRAEGFAVAWLRYNSGRSIPDNGTDLSRLLLQQFGESDKQLTLIGHSMGGLLIRSATHHAGVTHATWLCRLYQAAYLASPHFGAPLERAGNALNNSFSVTPYTKPFMRLGNIRSQGIRDLRYGRVHRDHSCTPLYAACRHFLLAASLSNSALDHWLGDGLVPVRSAHGHHDDPEQCLHAPDITRHRLENLNHMALLGDARVYSALEQWLAADAKQ